MPNARVVTPVVMTAGIVLLAGAAYLALSSTGRMPWLPGLAGAGRELPGGNYHVSPASELPPAYPDVNGALIEKKDNSLFVQPDAKGSGQTLPAVEAVVISTTRLYQDVTLRGGPLTADGRIQQRVGPASIQQISPGDTILAWGEKRGDRLIAEAVLVLFSRGHAAGTPAP